MAEYEDVKLTSPDEHIKDTSTCETVFTTNWRKDCCTTKALRKTQVIR